MNTRTIQAVFILKELIMQRRSVFVLSALALVSSAVFAQAYPNKVVKHSAADQSQGR